ncbi:MAG: hypothetical protein CME33_19725 [Gimesia sp.]|uniref:hypothetical protein n=1 Tax=Gimesia sp. TaxID=2024833 RepID=UPI000C55D2CF|nr:hypothetical protein [Gimesia sp.]MAX38793.1 hypothetical protein [Gimesia sp.]
MSKMKTVKRHTSKQVRRNLSDRMKKGELYVVFSGIDDEVMSLLTYDDPARTPRIYSKTALDPRVCEQLIICKSVESAVKCLGPETYAVVLPLSAMIEYYGEFEVRRWAKSQQYVSPTEVRGYVSKKVATLLVGNNWNSARVRGIYIKQVGDNHSRWISNNLTSTLADLLGFLECVRFEFLQYDPDELIVDHFEDLCNGSDYLLDFEDPSESVNGDELSTFEHQLETVEEDIMTLDELIELVGESFKLADLPSLEQPTSSPLILVG